MSNVAIKGEAKGTDYEKNLRKILGWGNSRTMALERYFGFLKGTLKKSGTAYQREIRKEWERKGAR